MYKDITIYIFDHLLNLESKITYPDFDYISNIVHHENKSFAKGCIGECGKNNNISSNEFIIEYEGYNYNPNAQIPRGEATPNQKFQHSSEFVKDW